jgi:uncharacterized delta-60 repeat protein
MAHSPRLAKPKTRPAFRQERKPARARLHLEQLELRLLLSGDPLTPSGLLHKDPGIETLPAIEHTASGAGMLVSAPSRAPAATNPLTSIPILNSLPGAAASLYLDFNGHFDATWGSYRNVTTPVFDQDGDATTFSDGELTTMHDIWTVVAEDYAPFKINVTTVQPASFANGVSIRVAIGGDGAWTGGTYGGISLIGSFTNSNVNTAYVFTANLANGYARYTGEASSHEAGHSFGLQHQSEYDASGTKINEYYAGPGDGRAPIMGVSYYVTRGLWWYGTSSVGATVYQDDMAVISNSTNGFGYRADDFPGTTALTVTGRDVSRSGIIEKTTDQDRFSFSAAAGEMNLSVEVPAGVGNLNARLELRDSLGNLLAVSDSANFASRRTITYAAAAGDYMLVVASHSGYGDVGQYTINGTIAVPSTINTPTSLIATALSTSQIDLTWTDNAGNETGYVVDRSTTAGQTWTRLTTSPLAADSTSFSDTTALPGTTHYYRVSAVNANDVSAYSNQASVTTVPAAPGTLAAYAVWTDSTYLAWVDVTGETGFKIQRSSDGGNVWSQIGSTGAHVTSYQDTGLQTASTYTYRVLATDAAGDSAFSNLATTTTLIAPPTAFGQGDGAYIAENWSGTYNDLRIQPDQKIVAAGTKYSTDPNAPSDHRMAIARYTSAGSADATYNGGVVAAPPLGSSLEYGNGLALQPDGKAVVTGLGGAGTAVARFTTNGSLDTSFDGDGWNSIDVRPDDNYPPASAVALQSTGKIVVAGISWGGSATLPAVLARFTASGAVDGGKTGFGKVVQGKAPGYTLSTFGGHQNDFNDLVIQPDDKIVVVGGSYSDPTGGLLVARFTASGVLDTTFNGSGSTVLLPAGLTYARAFGITLQSDGKIVIVGGCTGIDGSSDLLVARYNTNGTLDANFGGGNGYVRLDIDGAASQTSEFGRAIVIQSDGKIVVAGGFSAGANPSDVLVVRLNSNGTPDAGFGAGGFKIGALPPEMGSPLGLSGTGVALLGDGSIIVSGYGNWSPPGTGGLQNYHPLLMRFSGISTPSSPPQAAGGSVASSYPAPGSLAKLQSQPLSSQAVARGQTASLDAGSLRGIDIQKVAVPDSILVQASTITLAGTTAGWSRVVDVTIGNNRAFSASDNKHELNGIDVLTLLATESGHVLGFDHRGAEGMTPLTGAQNSPAGQWSVQDLAFLDWQFAGEQDSLS